MENLISKLNFFKLIPYLVDKGSPTLPSPLTRPYAKGYSEVDNKKRKSYTATWRVNRTLLVPARAQLRTFFSNVWQDAGHLHLSSFILKFHKRISVEDIE